MKRNLVFLFVLCVPVVTVSTLLTDHRGKNIDDVWIKGINVRDYYERNVPYWENATELVEMMRSSLNSILMCFNNFIFPYEVTEDSIVMCVAEVYRVRQDLNSIEKIIQNQDLELTNANTTDNGDTTTTTTETTTGETQVPAKAVKDTSLNEGKTVKASPNKHESNSWEKLLREFLNKQQ